MRRLPAVLLSWVVLCSLAAAQSQRLAPPDRVAALQAAAIEALGRPDARVQRVDVPVAAPERLTVGVVLGDLGRGHGEVLELWRHDLRAPGARLRAVGAAGTTLQPLPAPASFRGHVLGAPDTVVLASVADGRLRAEVYAAGGSTPLWSVLPLEDVLPGRAPAGWHVVSGGGRPRPELDCGAEAVEATAPAAPGGLQGQAGSFVPTCLTRAQIAFDADFEYYQLKGSSTAGVAAAIDDILNQVDYFYARDVRITYVLTEVVVRTAPFYTPTSGGDLLNQFRAQWNGPLSSVPRDMAHLMTAKPGSLIEFGGLAWVGAVCNDIAYGWSMDGANIVGHEVGHNWNAPHCLDPTPCNTMCGACFYVGPVTKGVMEAYRDSRACLEPVWLHPTALPPYVLDEADFLRKDEFEALGDLTFDVLANDEDGNCDPVSIASFEAVTARGATVSVSPGSGPQGRDELVYSLPDELFLGLDSVTYVVGDGTGQGTPGTVDVEVRPLRLAGRWALDETSGSAAADSAGQAADGVVLGGALWEPGVFDGALRFDGLDDAVEVPALQLATDELTIASWVRRDGNLSLLAGLVMCRGGTTIAGLHVGLFNDLRYTWDGQSTAWSSGLTLPDDQWVFVALTVGDGGATIYMHDGVTLHSAHHAAELGVEAFDDELYLGRDNTAGRHFRGWLDEVRVYDHALGADQVLALYELGGPAEAPRPSDGSPAPEPDGDLQWLAGLAADGHDVYLGTDYQTVRDATPASPEYLGQTPDDHFPIPALLPGTPYAWRVDTVVGGTTLVGDTWLTRRPDFRIWRLDELAGPTAADGEGLADGTYLGDPTFGEPGVVGTAVYLDGTGDRVRLPALDLNTDRLTITTWLRRDGDQNEFTGLVFSRAGQTAAGLNFGTANELRYHWNGQGSTWAWDSGLVVPDDTWVFAALIVEPERARLVLGDGGPLQVATNVVTHDPEEFDGITLLGRDSLSTARTFRGWLDDVRLYDEVLALGDLATLYAAGR